MNGLGIQLSAASRGWAGYDLQMKAQAEKPVPFTSCQSC